MRQASGDWRKSSNDLSAADEHLEWLDLTADPVGTLGEYLYSDSSKTYRPQPSAKLALNAFNLLNFLARGDLNGAAVEARRFTVMREALDAAGIEEMIRNLVEPESWQPQGKAGYIRGVAGRLVVKHRRRVHHQITGLLKKLQVEGSAAGSSSVESDGARDGFGGGAKNPGGGFFNLREP